MRGAVERGGEAVGDGDAGGDGGRILRVEKVARREVVKCRAQKAQGGFRGVRRLVVKADGEARAGETDGPGPSDQAGADDRHGRARRHGTTWTALPVIAPECGGVANSAIMMRVVLCKVRLPRRSTASTLPAPRACRGSLRR